MTFLTRGALAASLTALLALASALPAAASTGEHGGHGEHGALGGGYSLLTIDTSAQYPCDAGTCWGVLIGEGLRPVSEVIVNWAGGPGGSGEFAAFADNEGNLDGLALNLACGESISDVRAMGTTSAGLLITSTVHTAPC